MRREARDQPVCTGSRRGQGWRRVTRGPTQASCATEWTSDRPSDARAPGVSGDLRASSDLDRAQRGLLARVVGIGDLNGDDRNDVVVVTSFGLRSRGGLDGPRLPPAARRLPSDRCEVPAGRHRRQRMPVNGRERRERRRTRRRGGRDVERHRGPDPERLGHAGPAGPLRHARCRPAQDRRLQRRRKEGRGLDRLGRTRRRRAPAERLRHAGCARIYPAPHGEVRRARGGGPSTTTGATTWP